jgi:hypothetical protein
MKGDCGGGNDDVSSAPLSLLGDGLLDLSMALEK